MAVHAGQVGNNAKRQGIDRDVKILFSFITC